MGPYRYHDWENFELADKKTILRRLKKAWLVVALTTSVSFWILKVLENKNERFLEGLETGQYEYVLDEEKTLSLDRNKFWLSYNEETNQYNVEVNINGIITNIGDYDLYAYLSKIPHDEEVVFTQNTFTLIERNEEGLVLNEKNSARKEIIFEGMEIPYTLR